jgi:hypothetical protein
MGINFNRKQQQYSNPFRKGPVIDEVRHLKAQIKSLECFAGYCTGDPLCAPGGVVFTDINGNLDNDCNEFFWNDTFKQLGIGTNAPVSKLHVYSPGSTIATLESFAGNAIVHLKSNDSYGSYIVYQENTSGDQWQVGENGSTGAFEWIDGNDFGLHKCMALTKSATIFGPNTPSSLRLYDGQIGGPPSPKKYFSLRAPNVLAANTDYIWPTGYPVGVGDVLSSDLAGNLSWVSAGGSPWTLDGSDNLFTSNSAYAGAAGSDNIIGGRNTGSVGMSGVQNLTLGLINLNALTTGNGNIALGTNNFNSLADGLNNTALGSLCAPLLTSGRRNILIGHRPGQVLPQTGDENILIGKEVAVLAGLTAGFSNPGGGEQNILIGTNVLEEARDIGYPAAASVAQTDFDRIIGIGLEAGSYINSYNSQHSIFFGNYSSPIMSDISAPHTGVGNIRSIFSLTSGIRNMTAGGATDGAGQIVLYGHEGPFPTSGITGKMLMVGGGNTGDYNSTGNTYHETPNASLHVSGMGSQDATYVAPVLFPTATYADDHILVVEDGAGVSAGTPNAAQMFIVDHDGQIKMPNIPTGAGAAPAGLTSGSVWHDTTTDNLKIVP